MRRGALLATNVTRRTPSAASVLPALLSIVLAGCQDRAGERPADGVGSDSVGSAATTGRSTANAAGGEPLEGSIRGRLFRPNTVFLDGNTLRFCQGDEYFAEMEIHFDLKTPEGDRLTGRDWRFGGKSGEPALSLTSRAGGMPEHAIVFGQDYEMTLRITQQTRALVAGTIDLKFSYPFNTFLRGPFSAEYRKSITAPLDESDAPFVQGKIVPKGNDRRWSLTAGYIGIGDDGKVYANSAGFPQAIGQGGSVTTRMFAPRITSLTNDIVAGVIYRHSGLPPGDYLFYVRRNEIAFAWQRVRVRPGDKRTHDFTIDVARAGDVALTLAHSTVGETDSLPLAMIPLDVELPELGASAERVFAVGQTTAGEKTVSVSGVPAGRYRAVCGTLQAEVNVVAGKSTAITLGAMRK